MKHPLYLFPDMTNRKSLYKLTLHSRIKFDISLQDFFFLCVKALAIANPPKILYTYCKTIRNVFRVYFFFSCLENPRNYTSTNEKICNNPQKLATAKTIWFYARFTHYRRWGLTLFSGPKQNAFFGKSCLVSGHEWGRIETLKITLTKKNSSKSTIALLPKPAW